jgi:hypothetical protein
MGGPPLKKVAAGPKADGVPVDKTGLPSRTNGYKSGSA